MKPMHEDEARLARELEPRSAAVWAVFLVAIAALGVLMFAPTPPWPMAGGHAGRPALADSAQRPSPESPPAPAAPRPREAS
jgi:hypothetical protein